jgi:4-phytase/acid phosphatase
MGTYYRSYLAQLIPEACPSQDTVFFWADLDQRTQETAKALLSGFFQNSPKSCDLNKYLHTASQKPDGIFHPVMNLPGGRCSLNEGRARAEILDRAGGDLRIYVERWGLQEQIRTVQNTLQCCQQDLCAQLGAHCGKLDQCTLPGLPSCLVPHPTCEDPTQILLSGKLRIASTFAEILLLEYANGFAPKDVGWGRIDRYNLFWVFRLHTLAFDLEQRTDYIAKLQGSALLAKIRRALKGETDGKEGTAPPKAKLVAYVGHDTNIANVAGMLDLSWDQSPQSGYWRNQIPPASALIFELRRAADGTRNVYVSYVAQSLDDMNKATGEHPQRDPVRVPNCSTDAPGYPCPLERFLDLANKALDPSCVP